MAEPARDPQIPDLLSLQQAATRLGYSSKQSLLNRYNRGDIPGAKVGTAVVFRAEVIEALAADELPADA